MSFYTNLTAFKTAATAAITAALVTATLEAMDEYVLGGPSDDILKSCGFYLGVGDKDPENSRFKPVVQLQLPRLNYAGSLLYYDVIYDALYALDPVGFGMTTKERFSDTEFPPDETSSATYTFYPEYMKQLDDCDE